MIHFKILHSWPNLFGLMFTRNQKYFCMKLFLLKIANWRAIYVYLMTCSININEFKQVFTCSTTPEFFSLSTITFEFEHLFIIFPMKLFPAQTHFPEHRCDQSDYCTQIFLLPTATLKRFSWYFTLKFYQ